MIDGVKTPVFFGTTGSSFGPKWMAGIFFGMMV